MTNDNLPEPIVLRYNTERSKWLMSFDASAYSHSDCRRHMFYLIIKGLVSGKSDHKMEYGTAFHHAMAHYYTNKRLNMTEEERKVLQSESLGKALKHFMKPEIEIPEDDYRSPSHLIGCVSQYFEYYAADPLEVLRINGTAVVEQKFSLPFYTDELLEISLSGTIDFVGYLFDQLIIMDHKSTSANAPVWYLKEYVLSPQLMMYSWIFKQLFPTMVDDYYGIGTMINGVFLREKSANKFLRSEVRHFNNEQVVAFEKHLKETVILIAECFHKWAATGEEFQQNFTQCFSKFGCPYVGICSSGRMSKAKVIEENYRVRLYDPLLFQV